MLYETIKKDMMTARKNKESDKASWLSTLMGELQRGGGKEFDDAQVLTLLKKNVQTLKENLKVSPNHEPTQKEIEFLSTYLPQQMSDDEIRSAVQALISEGADSIKALMSGMQARHSGLYDGRSAATIIKEELAK